MYDLDALADSVWTADIRTLNPGIAEIPTTEAERIAECVWRYSDRTVTIPDGASGNGIGTIEFGGSGAGYAVRSGAGSGTVEFGVQAEGYAPPEDHAEGSGVGTITLGGLGGGYALRSGSGTGTVTLRVLAEGQGASVAPPINQMILDFSASSNLDLDFGQ